eukprot:Pgem_evm1s13758
MIDVKKVTDINTLFRSNSLATKAYDNFLKLFGKNYLEELLQPIIDNILDNEDMNCELDPTRVAISDRIQPNVWNLQNHCSNAIETICSSLPKVV